MTSACWARKAFCKTQAIHPHMIFRQRKAETAGECVSAKCDGNNNEGACENAVKNDCFVRHNGS